MQKKEKTRMGRRRSRKRKKMKGDRSKKERP
jgi:hypothetical protein